MMTCKNCGKEIAGKFCDKCGQPADTLRIDRKFIIREMRNTFVHFWNDGLFYTTKSLFTSPGRAIKEYLDGKRIQHIKPFTFLILVGGLYVLLSRLFNINMFNGELEGHQAKELNNLLYSYYTQVQLLLLLFYAAFSALFFKSAQYNFYEFLVIHTYLAGQRMLIAIVLLIPLLILLNGKWNPKTIMYISAIPGEVLMIWTYCVLFKDRSPVLVIAKTVLMELLSLFIASFILALLLMSF